MKKEKIIEVIKKLPENFSVDELLDEILLIQKIEKGMEQSDQNHIIPDDQLDQELPEWLR